MFNGHFKLDRLDIPPPRRGQTAQEVVRGHRERAGAAPAAGRQERARPRQYLRAGKHGLRPVRPGYGQEQIINKSD